MSKLLILGTNYGAVEMIEYAKSIGVYTIATDYLPLEKSIAKQAADEYWMISTNDLETLERKCRDESVTAIACGISEFNQDIALELCERLGLPNYATKDAWHFNRNKADFKEVCKKVGAPVATDYYLSDALTEDELNAVKFPVVVKPVDKCGNAGVAFCHNKRELINAYRYARSISDNNRIIVERLIHGEEYIGLYALANGEVSQIGLVSSYVQPGEPTNCYVINTTINQHIRHYLEDVNEYAVKVLKNVGCKEGFAWLQFMHDWDDGVDYLIEMGYRMPGDITLFPAEQLTGFDAIKWMVECALGIKHTVHDLPKQQTGPFVGCACSYMMWTNKAGTLDSIQGLDKLAEIPGLRVVRSTARSGDLVSQYHPVGTILFVAKDCNHMCDLIAYINQNVAVLNEEGEDMMIHFTDFSTLKKRYVASFRTSLNEL